MNTSYLQAAYYLVKHLAATRHQASRSTFIAATLMLILGATLDSLLNALFSLIRGFIQ